MYVANLAHRVRTQPHAAWTPRVARVFGKMLKTLKASDKGSLDTPSSAGGSSGGGGGADGAGTGEDGDLVAHGKALFVHGLHGGAPEPSKVFIPASLALSPALHRKAGGSATPTTHHTSYSANELLKQAFGE